MASMDRRAGATVSVSGVGRARGVAENPVAASRPGVAAGQEIPRGAVAFGDEVRASEAAAPSSPVGAAQIEEWNEVAQDWSGEKHSTWRSHSDRLNVEFLRAHAPAHRVERILKTDVFDEAVRVGGIVPALLERGKRVTVLDLSPHMLHLAAGRRDRGSMALDLAGGDVRRLPFADGSFDLIFSNSTLDHLGSLDEIALSIGELARILRPGGRLLLTLDNAQNPVIALRALLPRDVQKIGGVVPYPVGPTCGRRRLVKMVESAGLKVRATGTLVHSPRLLMVPLSAWIDRRDHTRAKKIFSRAAVLIESLGRLPTRYFTGHFVSVVAERSSND
jgi:SAM-dependent methyltransferase